MGADFVGTIDVDEFFWCASGDLAAEVRAQGTDAIECGRVTLVQRREQVEIAPDLLLTMNARVDRPTVPLGELKDYVEMRRASFVEGTFPPKWIFRPEPGVRLEHGMHHLFDFTGTRARSTAIEILHAPLRAKDVFAQRAEHGRRADELGLPPRISWQSRWWRDRFEAGEIDEEWAANSYRDERIDVYGRERQLVRDDRLRDLADRWIGDRRLALR